MRKSAAHLSWDEIDEAGLRAGIAAIERRDSRLAGIETDAPSVIESQTSVEIAHRGPVSPDVGVRADERPKRRWAAKRATSSAKSSDTRAVYRPPKI